MGDINPRTKRIKQSDDLDGPRGGPLPYQQAPIDHLEYKQSGERAARCCPGKTGDTSGLWDASCEEESLTHQRMDDGWGHKLSLSVQQPKLEKQGPKHLHTRTDIKV